VNVPHPRNQEIFEAGIESCLRTIDGAAKGKEEAVFSEFSGHAIRHAYSAGWTKAEIVDRLDNAGAAIGLDADLRQRILRNGILRTEGADTAGEIPAGMEHIETAIPRNIKNGDPWWRDPATIPPRAFLYDRHYSRRNIGATIAAGGRAKTTLSVYEALSMAVGRDLSTRLELSSGPLRVWLLNGEEDQDELDRRIAAACQRYGISQEDLGGRLFAQSVRDKPLRIAKLANNAPTVDEQMKAFMVDFITTNRIDVFMVDPLISFHAVSENSNEHMDVVIKQGFGAIAGKTNSAGEVFHHPGKPKPGQTETTVEDSRGASAVIWAVRSARVNNFMTPEEATKLGLSETERRLHIRLTNGKANMGPIGMAKWIKLVIENLPNGDQVAVASCWTPPDPFKGITTADMELAQKLAATGEYRADSRSPNWIGYPVAAHLQIKVSHKGENNPKDVARLSVIVKTWFKNKVLDIEERKDADGKMRKFVVAGVFKPSSPEPVSSEDEELIQ
jgi:AAA domain